MSIPPTDPSTWPPDADRWILNPLYLTSDVTDLILPGGLDGYVLLGVTGPPVTLHHRPSDAGAWVAVTLPFEVPPGAHLRLNRVGGGAAVTMIRAVAPVLNAAGSAPGLTSSTDAQGYVTLHGAELTTDADGYQTLTNAQGTADPDGYVTVPVLPSTPPTDPGGF